MALDLNPTQTSLIAASYKTVSWLFRVSEADGTTYYWCTKDITATPAEVVQWASGTQWAAGNQWTAGETKSYTFKIINFSGIELQQVAPELRIIGPTEVWFTVSNPGHTLTPSDFVGGVVAIFLQLSDGTNTEIIRRWQFNIKNVEPTYQQFKIYGEDWAHEFLDSEFPKTRYVKELFVSDDTDSYDNYCVPETVGQAYIPLRSIYSTGSTGANKRHYLLGTTDYTYTINEVRSPEGWVQ